MASSKEPKYRGVWRRARWDWAYKFQTDRGQVFGCGFRDERRAREAMKDALAEHAEADHGQEAE